MDDSGSLSHSKWECKYHAICVIGQYSIGSLDQYSVGINSRRSSKVENALYDDFRDNRIRSVLRLEQEYVGYSWLNLRLQRLLDNAE